jgi:hypothetical protein
MVPHTAGREGTGILHQAQDVYPPSGAGRGHRHARPHTRARNSTAICITTKAPSIVKMVRIQRFQAERASGPHAHTEAEAVAADKVEGRGGGGQVPGNDRCLVPRVRALSALRSRAGTRRRRAIGAGPLLLLFVPLMMIMRAADYGRRVKDEAVRTGGASPTASEREALGADASAGSDTPCRPAAVGLRRLRRCHAARAVHTYSPGMQHAHAAYYGATP